MMRKFCKVVLDATHLKRPIGATECGRDTLQYLKLKGSGPAHFEGLPVFLEVNSFAILQL